MVTNARVPAGLTRTGKLAINGQTDRWTDRLHSIAILYRALHYTNAVTFILLCPWCVLSSCC